MMQPTTVYFSFPSIPGRFSGHLKIEWPGAGGDRISHHGAAAPGGVGVMTGVNVGIDERVEDGVAVGVAEGV